MSSAKGKVIVAMSGGVDSSLAAALMVEQGYETIGVTMKLLKQCDSVFGCCGSPEDMSIAKRSAEKIGIPHYILDFSEDFEKDVIDYFVDAYVRGETPNPCIACNRRIKFNKLDEFVRSLKAQFLVTGHYAQISDKITAGQKSFHLYEAADKTKDQSYVLYHFTQRTLSQTLLPLAGLNKTEVREKAKQWGLPNHDKKDSQEICFIPGNDYVPFVLGKLKEKGGDIPATVSPGPIRDTSGKIVGRHKGVSFFTVGQRKGLGLTVPKPVYVVDLDAQTNTLVVGPDDKSLTRGLAASDLNWIAGGPPASPFSSEVKIRYKHEPGRAKVFITHDGAEVQFEDPQRAVTPGQSVVFYRWDEELKTREVLGGEKL